MRRIAAAMAVCGALVLTGCDGTGPASDGDAANPAVETGQTTFICAGDTSGSLLQWNDLDGALTGAYTYTELSGSAPNEKVSPSSTTLTGTRDGSSITLSLDVLFARQPLSGTVSGKTLTLNVPQTDGSLQAATCRAGTLEEWNDFVGQLADYADNDNAWYLEQEAQASSDAADVQAQQDFDRALAAVQDFSLADDLAQVADDVETVRSDLDDVKAAAALGATIPGELECSNLNYNVASGAQFSVASDAQYSFGSDLRYYLLDDIADGRKAIAKLHDAVAALQSRNLEVPDGVDAVTGAAEGEIAQAVTTANGYVDQVNAYVDEAYAVTNSLATGACADDALGAPPEHIAHVSG